MSKRKVGKLYRKRIVEGNINEIDSNSEVHISELGGGEGEGDNKYKVTYYDISTLPNTAEDSSVLTQTHFMTFSSLLKGSQGSGGDTIILPPMNFFASGNTLVAAAVMRDMPIFFATAVQQVTTIGEYIDMMSTISGVDFSTVKEISEEEFYKLD